jgi:hypothetical protein
VRSGKEVKIMTLSARAEAAGVSVFELRQHIRQERSKRIKAGFKTTGRPMSEVTVNKKYVLVPVEEPEYFNRYFAAREAIARTIATC